MNDPTDAVGTDECRATTIDREIKTSRNHGAIQQAFMDDFAAGFLAGFRVSREGFNQECAYDHLAPSMHNCGHRDSGIDPKDSPELCLLLADALDEYCDLEYDKRSEWRLRALVARIKESRG